MLSNGQIKERPTKYSTSFVDVVIESHDPAKRWPLTEFYVLGIQM